MAEERNLEARRPSPVPIRHELAARYFGTPGQSLMTIGLCIVAGWAAWQAVRWAVLDATFVSADRAGCAPGGACWAFVLSRLDQFLFGFYPTAERWRPAVVLLLPAAVFVLAVARPFARQSAIVGTLVLATPLVSIAMLSGGFLGLLPVSPDKWGGLSLTVVVAITSFVLSLPLAVLLALARRSDMPVISMLATGFIELWRGLPLVGILFMAVILLPLVLPPGTQVSRVGTAMTALTIYSAAYLAEVVRAGLQAIPAGQFRASRALGFGYWRTQYHVALPQAFGKVLPGVINAAIALVKDTSYVMIVGLFDFINIVTAALSDPRWIGSPTEAYVFVAAVYWIICFGLSRWGRSIERRSARSRGLARA
ncbi:amino acid ABC transporter permease [Alsobacter sp. R-9]